MAKQTATVTFTKSGIDVDIPGGASRIETSRNEKGEFYFQSFNTPEVPLFTVAELSTPKGFIGCWFRMLGTIPKHMDAYEQTEKQYFTLFGVKKYKNYEAFKRSKNYHTKNKK
jgi:hypothetical protein